MAQTFARISLAVIAASWLLFVVSFFLPATNVLETGGTPPGTPLTGWQAFTASMTCGVMNPLVWIAEPCVLLFLIFPFANGLMLFSPMLILVDRQWFAALILICVPCAIVPWLMPAALLGDLFPGFYCWNGSFFLMAFGGALAVIARVCGDRDWRKRHRSNADSDGIWPQSGDLPVSVFVDV